MMLFPEPKERDGMFRFIKTVYWGGALHGFWVSDRMTSAEVEEDLEKEPLNSSVYENYEALIYDAM